jgi:transposase
MRRFVEGVDREQTTLFPECLEDWIGEDSPVRVIDAFVEELDLAELGFDGVDPEATGRPSYHPSVLLKLYIYGYLNRVQSSRRLEYEAGRNVEVMWLSGRLAPDHKTIADFRKDNGGAIRKVCAQFIALCRAMGLLTQASVAIDGSKFKAVNNRDKNFTRAKMERRMAQIEESVARYLEQLDTADRQEPSEALLTKTNRLKEKIETLKQQMRRLERLKVEMLADPDQQISLTDPDARSMATSATCTTGKERRVSRWEYEHILEAVQRRLDEHPEKMRQRRETVEHPFGTIKARMGATHFLMKTLPRVASEMALHVLAYNLTRVMNIMGIQPLMAAMRA